jgi:branched-subunit amino acid ABC-type transport system permease component
VRTLSEILVYGFLTGSLIAVGATGFSLQFGVTNVLNLAYGATMTSAIFVNYALSPAHPGLLETVLISGLWGAGFQWLLSAGIINRYIKRGTSLFGMAMVTFGLGLVVQFSLEAIQGPLVLTFTEGNSRIFRFGSISVSSLQVWTAVVALVLMVAVHALLRGTRLGLAIRATAVSPVLARTSGVSTKRTRAVAWCVSGALCGIAGGLLGLNQASFNSVTGNEFFITVVAGAVLGGMGSAYGAMLGAMAIALISEASAALISPSYKFVVAFVVLVAILLVRPQGLMGGAGSRRVLAA